MLHVGRCGSTVLANLLMQNPRIYWDGKLYRKAAQLYGYETVGFDYSSWTKRQLLVSGSRFYGFEFKILQDQYPDMLGVTLKDFLGQCSSIGITHYILLFRKNTLRHVASHYASKARGNWHISDTGSSSLQKFSIDVDSVSTGSGAGRSLESYMKEVDDTHNEVRKALRNQLLLEIEYETDIEEKGAIFAYEKICKFINLEPGTVSVRNRKINPFTLGETILNYEEVVSALRGTGFEWMLEDERSREA